MILNGGSNRNSTGTTPYTVPFQQAIVKLFIDVFAMMRRDVDIERVEFAELLYCLKQTLCAIAFQWREHLKGEVAGVWRQTDDFCQAHPLQEWNLNAET